MTNFASSFSAEVANRILAFLDDKLPDKAYKEYQTNIVKAFQGLIDQTFHGSEIAGLTGGTTEMIVNIYGTKDILTDLGVNGNKIGGYRSELGGFLPNAQIKRLVNIEIVGAKHTDYMRRENELTIQSILNGGIVGASAMFAFNKSQEWNKTVSAFVADVMNNSQDANRLDQFLIGHPEFATLIGDKWIIKLSGWQEHE